MKRCFMFNLLCGMLPHEMEVVMKCFLLSFFALLIILSGCAILRNASAGESEAPEETSGEATRGTSGEATRGSAQGYRGEITVQVQMDGNQIADIVIIDYAEDRFVGGAAIEELIDMVIMYNTTDLDAVSGATESSRGFLEAVQNAILVK